MVAGRLLWALAAMPLAVFAANGVEARQYDEGPTVTSTRWHTTVLCSSTVKNCPASSTVTSMIVTTSVLTTTSPTSRVVSTSSTSTSKAPSKYPTAPPSSSKASSTSTAASSSIASSKASSSSSKGECSAPAGDSTVTEISTVTITSVSTTTETETETTTTTETSVTSVTCYVTVYETERSTINRPTTQTITASADHVTRVITKVSTATTTYTTARSYPYYVTICAGSPTPAPPGGSTTWTTTTTTVTTTTYLEDYGMTAACTKGCHGDNPYTCVVSTKWSTVTETRTTTTPVTVSETVVSVGVNAPCLNHNSGIGVDTPRIRHNSATNNSRCASYYGRDTADNSYSATHYSHGFGFCNNSAWLGNNIAGLGDHTAGLGDNIAGLGDHTAGLGDHTAGLGDHIARISHDTARVVDYASWIDCDLACDSHGIGHDFHSDHDYHPYNNASDLTWGCSPGKICYPRKPDGCLFWASPPAKEYVCESQEYCIDAQPYKSVNWASDESSYFPPTEGYYNLPPIAFGLSYDIFLEENATTICKDSEGHEFTSTFATGNWESQTSITRFPPASTYGAAVPTYAKRAPVLRMRQNQQLSENIVPSMCYAICNTAYLEAQKIGKGPLLCKPDSDFNQYVATCNECSEEHKSELKVTNSRGMTPYFSQYLDYCSVTPAGAVVSDTTSAVAEITSMQSRSAIAQNPTSTDTSIVELTPTTTSQTSTPSPTSTSPSSSPTPSSSSTPSSATPTTTTSPSSTATPTPTTTSPTSTAVPTPPSSSTAVSPTTSTDTSTTSAGTSAGTTTSAGPTTSSGLTTSSGTTTSTSPSVTPSPSTSEGNESSTTAPIASSSPSSTPAASSSAIPTTSATVPVTGAAVSRFAASPGTKSLLLTICAAIFAF
ncbi:uncharacterized protein PG986_006335 [Apiospora aurea]|uniref:Uncharacterized protein n=1 Tax=Apiospora aurea TaxID=335848 RepID=A0ABR1QK58_9PEZI